MSPTLASTSGDAVQSAEYPVTFRFGVSWSCLAEPQRYPRMPELSAPRTPTVFTAATPVLGEPAAAPERPKSPRVFTSVPPPENFANSTLALPASYLHADPPVAIPAAPALQPPSQSPSIQPPANRSLPNLPGRPNDPPPPRAPIGLGSPRTTTQWEMVVPKMSRPVRNAPLPEGNNAAGAPRQLADSRSSIGAGSVAASPCGFAPSFGESSASSNPSDEIARPRASASLQGLWKSTPLPFKLTLAGAAAVIIGFVAWPSPAPSAPKITGEWMHPASASPAVPPAIPGIAAIPPKPVRQFVYFRASRPISDYRLAFDWAPNTKGAGWVFRAADNRYYVGGRVSLLPFRTPPTIVVERFTVSAGNESPHFRALVSLTGDEFSGVAPNASLPPVEIAMDALGPRFNIYVQGKPADSWIDQQFMSGDAGFYWDRETAPGGAVHDEFPQVHSVRLSFLNPAALVYAGDFPVEAASRH